MAISGDYALVGAPGHDDATDNTGAAYLYQRNSGGVDNWGEVIKLTASDAATQDDFGFSVAVSGDQLMVGAYNPSPATILLAGSAYIYVDINSQNVPALSTNGKVVLALLMIAAVMAGLYRTRQVGGSGDHHVTPT